MEAKTALVTGAAGSLGSELSLQLSQAGWNVVLLDSNRQGLEQAYDRISEDGPGAAALYPMDLLGANPELVEELLAKVESEFGGLDAVVHCAAHFQSLTPAEHIQPEEWLVSMQVNLNAPWLLSAMALPLLRRSENGKLVFVLEDLEKVCGAFWGAYGVSKHALHTLVRQLAAECRKSSVDVAGVNPGPMRSSIRTRVYHSENPADMPSPQPVAARLLRYLEGEEKWKTDLVDLQTPVSD